ncbi:MAG: ATP-grasp domain-containing protein [Gemmatimonadota bacterium]|nr:MAG: ATP-grasp domain-containing protein [Gemmatimonadota bacterium]
MNEPQARRQTIDEPKTAEKPAPQEGAEPPDKPTSVVVLYNQVGEDWYEKLQQVDLSTLPFEPEYPVHVPTVREEYSEVARALRRAGYRARAVNLENDLRRLERVLKRNRPDVIFNLVEFFHDDAGLEAAVAGMYDVYRIAYTGAPPFALSLCQDKGLTKRVLQDHGVPTPRFKVFYEPKLPKRLGLRYPVIVKPVWEDASAGVTKDSVLYDSERLAERVEHVYQEYGAIIVEEFIVGRELHVSVWGNDQPEVLPPVEFDFSELPPDYPPIISYSAKWNPLSEIYHKVHTICPAPLPKRLLNKVEKVAIRAYQATECRDYARVDIRLKGNEPYVLEVNPNPDLTEGVSFMDSAERAGYSFSAALARIVEFAARRRPAPKPAGEQPEGRRPGEDLMLFPKIETPPADAKTGPPAETEPPA